MILVNNLKLNLIKLNRKDLNTLSLPGRGVIVVQETLLFGSVAPSCTPLPKIISWSSNKIMFKVKQPQKIQIFQQFRERERERLSQIITDWSKSFFIKASASSESGSNMPLNTSTFYSSIQFGLFGLFRHGGCHLEKIISKPISRRSGYLF